MKIPRFFYCFLAGILFCCTAGAQRCDRYSRTQAAKDLKEGKAVLVLYPGFVSARHPGDTVLERRYGVRFQHPGCMLPGPEACIAAYNREVMRLLTKKYGRSWRLGQREDIIR